MQWDEVPSITIRFGGKLVIEGKATAFTNSAIEAAIIHCRTLLEFLGLGESSQTKLREFDIRNRIDDDAIELYDGLSKVSIKKAVEGYHGTADEAEAALAYIVYLANKGLAHTTTSFTKHDKDTRFLEIAFGVTRMLVINNFYIPLGIQPPKELSATKRDI